MAKGATPFISQTSVDKEAVMKRILFLLLLTIQANAFAAGWESGNDLNNMLSQPENNFFAAGMAAGYITAIADERSYSMDWIMMKIMSDPSTTQQQKGQLVEKSFGMLKEHWVCFPKGVTVSQLAAVVKNWLAKNPQRWNENASKLVQDALKENFPCNSVNDLMK